MANRSRVERFLRPLDRDGLRTVSGRDDVYACASAALRGEAVTYLEFGVHEGRSLRYFADALDAPGTRLHAFDSFRGLPEDWNTANPKGTFATAGTPPSIDDDRVEFHVGWFDQTLPTFDPPREGRLVVNVDCDLYSSTVTVLEWLGPRLIVGDLLYFDEFADLEHEFRAFLEFIEASRIVVRPLARSLTWNNVLFEVAAVPRPER